MHALTTVHSTFVLERNYPAAPGHVFNAFADPAKKRRWFVESPGHDIQSYELDFRVGGHERSRLLFKEGHPLPGIVCGNDSVYLDIVPGRRIVQASQMALSGKIISASLVTIEFLPGDSGTDMVLTHQGAFFEGADGPAMREDGWRKLLDKLAAAA